MITDDRIKAMNPDMAATWIVGSGGHLSKAQWQVLIVACRNGGYVEAGTGEHNGRVERIAASPLLALVRRGYLTHCYGSEGGVAGRLSEQSRAKLADALKGQPVKTDEAPSRQDETPSAREKREDRERSMFGCTAAAIDGVLHGMEPRDVARYAMGTLSNAQEMFRRREYEDGVEWSVDPSNANAIRQLMNVAKYAIDKAVPR